MEPEVSFIIPARDEATMVVAAPDSVVQEVAPDVRLETIVVDNRSRDATGRIAQSFTSAHPELQVTVVRKDVVGRSRAKNTGAEAARGRLLIFLDADSRASPGLAAAVIARHAANSTSRERGTGGVPTLAMFQGSVDTFTIRLRLRGDFVA